MRREVMICFGLAAITLALFWPVSEHDFINLDDPDYVTQNRVVQAGFTGPGLHWAFGASHANNWHPLTWLSHMLDCQLFGLKPGAHHLVAVGFHIASTALLFLTLRQMTGAVWRSALVSALFAWHPLHIESVAWVAERKDVLSALFFMLTLWAYARCAQVRSPQSTVHSHAASRFTSTLRSTATEDGFHVSLLYVLSLLFFALGLMSKPMLVTLPLVLLLLDYWPLKRMKNVESRMKKAEPGTGSPFIIHHSTFIILETQKACTLAAASGDEALAGKNQQLLRLYRENRPFHEAAPPEPAGSEH